MIFKSKLSANAMFSINGSRRKCNNWIYATEDKKEIEFLKKNTMFEAAEEKVIKQIVEEAPEVEGVVVSKKKKGFLKRG